MRVLHVLDHSLPLFSGYTFRSQSILRQQRDLGITPVVLTSPKQGSKADTVDELEGMRYYRSALRSSELRFLGEAQLMARMVQRIAEVVAEEKIEILHSHSPLLNGLPALWVARKFKIPLVYEARAFWEDAAVNHGTFGEHSFRYRLSRSLETFLFRHATRVVTICQAMRQELIRRGIEASKIAVVPNGVDAEWFCPQARAETIAAQLGLNGGVVFGFIGSFYHYEGLEFLVRMAPQLVKQLPGAKIVLVGAGREEEALKEKAKHCGDAVIFAGQVPHERIRDFYSIMDVFVCPRDRVRLTELVTPLKPLEAMGMAKTVLASDVGGHRELIQHEKTGLLFRAEDGQDFVLQAVRAGINADLRRSLGANARRYVATERGWPKVVARYADIYRDAISHLRG